MRGGWPSDQGGELLDYLVIAASVAHGATLALALSPRVMCWSENQWLIDLRPTRHYWTVQARRRGVKVGPLLQMVLAEAAAQSGDSGAELLSESLVFAPCPWQALLLSAHLKERGLAGPLELREPFSQALLRQLSWIVWFDVAKEYAAALARSKLYGFKEERLRKDLSNLERAVLRLGQKHPAQMVDASSQSFRRRFGEHIARLWQWTFDGVAKDVKTSKNQQGSLGFAEEVAFASAFPWINVVISEKPQVVRHLEYPVWSWEQLVAALTTDLDRLADIPALALGAAVVRLEWILHLEDLSDCRVTIAFRHPHSLKAERGAQKTALSQAAHSFEAVYLRRRQDVIFVAPVPLIGWSLVVAESLARAPTATDLFGDAGFCRASELTVERIDNQLHIALERYQVTSDWAAEGAFTAKLAGSTTASLAKPWSALAATRPLYLYSEPRLLNAREVPLQAEFIERTGEVWWQRPEGALLERNYFLIQSRFGQRSWATKGEAGEWWVHGLFA